MSLLATQPLIDGIPIPRRLGYFKVLTPEYDPHFKPMNGYLKAKYNGLDIQIQIVGVDVTCHVCSIDTECFEVRDNLAEPSTQSWSDICQHMLGKVLLYHHQLTLDYKKHLISRGRYYVN